ncbi:dihydrodipicolinate synthase [Skeletonema marinoi]|uniref:Dihydrodipicolinate synthase n=1 Tax=Skeletonema marinoi TaxID=267567 RepID=A0AAD9D749_9STRA|nr:dihydrodipicolinate synthase [Skeletonema marinoi]
MILHLLNTFLLLHCANAFSTSTNANEMMPMQQGSSCAIITPMLDSGKIDIPSLRNLLKYHLDAGTDNLCILGTTGEASVLTMDERAQVITTAVDMAKARCRSFVEPEPSIQSM